MSCVLWISFFNCSTDMASVDAKACCIKTCCWYSSSNRTGIWASYSRPCPPCKIFCISVNIYLPNASSIRSDVFPVLLHQILMHLTCIVNFFSVYLMLCFPRCLEEHVLFLELMAVKKLTLVRHSQRSHGYSTLIPLLLFSSSSGCWPLIDSTLLIFADLIYLV